MPSALPELPALPARVVTTPAGVTFRIVWLSVSATYTLPALSTATPLGIAEPRGAARAIGTAGVPGLPARVVTTPAGVTFRIVWLSVSATYTLPALSTATPEG